MSSENDKTVQRFLEYKLPGFSGRADANLLSFCNAVLKKDAETYDRLFNKIEEEERDFYRSKRGMTESQMVDKVQKIIEDFLR